MSESNSSGGSTPKRRIISQVKKYRLKRKGSSLKIETTEDELKYRKNYIKFNVISDFPNAVCCTKCGTSFKRLVTKGEEIDSHPLLDVLMCKSCCEFYGDGDFSLDEDDEDKYCRWCGEGGELFLCSKCICGFCPKCIKKHFGKEKVNEIKKDDDWICYICHPEPLWKLRNICHLAKKQSEERRNESRAVSENLRRRSLKRDSKIMDSEKSDKNEEDKPKRSSANGVPTRNSYREYRRLVKCPDTYKPKKGSFAESSSSSDEESNGKEPANKKRKISVRSPKGKISLVNGHEDEESSSSESEDEIEVVGKGEQVEKSEYAEKVKEILKTTETASDMCFKMCKKKLKKLDKMNGVVSKEKLFLYCENIKAMVILMSSSLATVHHKIINLQRKFGNNGEEGMLHGSCDASLLKAFNKIFLKKKMKTSYVIRVVKDILNRYPWIKLNWNNIIESVVGSGCAIQNDSLTSDTDTMGNDTRNNMIKDSLNNNWVRSKKLNKTSPEKNSEEIIKCESDISTDIFDFDEQTVNDAEPSKNDNSTSVFMLDNNKICEKSLKLKEQLLMNSSDESSLDEMDLSDSSSTSSIRRKKRVNRRNSKRKRRSKTNTLSEEQREIYKLTNLRTLERKVNSQDSDLNSSSDETNAARQRRDRKTKKADQEEQDSSDNDMFKCADGNTSGRTPQLPSHQDEIEFVQNCGTFIKKYLLNSTSSEEEDVNDEKPEKIKRKKYFSKKRETSRIRTSFSDSARIKILDGEKTEDEREMGGEEKARNSEKEKSSSSGEESSDSFITTQLHKKKRKSAKIVTSESDEITPVIGTPPKSPGRGRKMIRKILKTGSLQLGTRQAIKVENERKKRLAERNESYNKFFPKMEESDRLVLDFDVETGEVLLEAPRALVKNLKPHQKQGVKFMWDNCFESLSTLEESNGSGCILAHCMGLGKSLQVITLLATVMNYNLGVDTVLILCPLNVVNNWEQEFHLWLKDVDFDIDVYNIMKCKRRYQRYDRIRQWHTEGGVLILSYDTLRTLTNEMKEFRYIKKNSEKFSELLLDPGPNLVVCDEGHVLKNEGTSISKCMARIKTSRRIVLTGTPLQNNLLEYHTMVQFIKPNVLGTRKEFMNRFSNPIRNGQFEDSNERDVKLMRARAHVLHKLLDGCIQRFSYSVLTPFLPEKHEYVISIRLTETQAKLYRYYIAKCVEAPAKDTTGTKLFKDFHWCQKIWTHPKIVYTFMKEREERSDGEREAVSSSDESVICIEPDSSETPYWKQVITPEECDQISGSGKLLVLFDIISYCSKIGDKVLVFSQSLKSLNLIEYFLCKINTANSLKKKKGETCKDIPPEYLYTWVKDLDYFRMDGSTDSKTRSTFCRLFNDNKQTRARLFLISTKAGGLGINLVGANRVVIFDISWNPSHDVQSIFRVYRFGQLKPCYIYRLVAEATMEEKVYEKQVTKLSLEKRVLDEHQIGRHYTMSSIQALYIFNPLPRKEWAIPMVPKDILLAEILNLRREVIVTYHEHDSLLENKEEEQLSEEERKAAWEDFEKERFMIEQRLENSASIARENEHSQDELTLDVIRLARLFQGVQSQPTTSAFQTNPTLNSNSPFKITNVRSLKENFPQPYATQVAPTWDTPL